MILIYDGSYEGLLSCVFVIFRERLAPTAIHSDSHHQPTFFDASRIIPTNEDWAIRVIKGIDARTNNTASELIYKIYLSELPNSELLVYQVVRAIIQAGNGAVLENFANPAILQASQIEKMMHREIHRMHAFVRFQKSKNGLFCAVIEPDFNVLPLIGDHFERRYADQSWLIFDTRRHYGIYYDQKEIQYVGSDHPVLEVNIDSPYSDAIQDEKEKHYQSLWKNYFHAVNIRERNNEKLHLRHMPRRYWKYLTEKY